MEASQMLCAPLWLWNQMPRTPARGRSKKSMLHGLRCRTCDFYVPSCLRLWGMRVFCPEDRETGWSSYGLLSSLSRCDMWWWCAAGPNGPVISLGLPYQGTSWSQRDGCALWKQTFVFSCFMTSASGKALAPPVWPENLDDDAWGRRQRVALSGNDLSWVQSSGLGRIKQIIQDHHADWEGKKTNGNFMPGTFTHTVSLDSLQPCEMSIFILQCEIRSSERENYPKISRL